MHANKVHTCENTSQWAQTIHCVLRRSAEAAGRLQCGVDASVLASQKREQSSKVRIFGSKTKSRRSMQSVPTLPSNTYLGMQINLALCTALIRSLALKVRIFGRQRRFAHWCGSGDVLHSPLRILKILSLRVITPVKSIHDWHAPNLVLYLRAQHAVVTLRLHLHHLQLKGELFREHRRASFCEAFNGTCEVTWLMGRSSCTVSQRTRPHTRPHTRPRSEAEGRLRQRP